MQKRAKKGSAKKSRAKQAEPLGFEEALTRLEAVVDQLEEGELQLEASLQIFEEGVRLSRECAAQLDAAEARIEVLTREGEAWKAEPLRERDDLDAESASQEESEG